MAHRGTLFLDEISELDAALQSKLLQLLQDGQFCRIGAQEDKKVEVRVVCATIASWKKNSNGTFARICSIASTLSIFRFRRCANAAVTSRTGQLFPRLL